MGASMSLAKTLLIPASIALAIYLLFSFLIIPFFRRYHARYSQYLPLHAISAHTTSLKDRIAETVMRLVLPRSWRRAPDDNENISIYDEEGEIMVGMDMERARREALEQGRVGGEPEGGRLSRDLEQGFMDDSDDDGSHGRGRGDSRGTRE